MNPNSLLTNLPSDRSTEVFETLAKGDSVRIERIVSHGHTSPENGWYDQKEDEWVLVVRGRARIAFEDGREVEMHAGDHLTLPAHCRHRVSYTATDEPTIWLAVFFAAD